MRVSITSNVDNVTRYLTNIADKQLKFATALALTKVAKTAQADLKKEMKRAFDRPTPYTLRSVFVKPANKRSLFAEVGIKDVESGGNSKPASKILRHEFKGGSRGRSRLEFWLSQAGLISSREYVAPGQEARLDRYGNMSRGQVQQIMSQLKVGPDPLAYASGSKQSRSKRSRLKGYFWSKGGQLPRGVWMRDGGDVLPVAIVIRKPRYYSAINIRQVVEKTVKRVAAVEIEKAINYAIRTAK